MIKLNGLLRIDRYDDLQRYSLFDELVKNFSLTRCRSTLTGKLLQGLFFNYMDYIYYGPLLRELASHNVVWISIASRPIHHRINFPIERFIIDLLHQMSLFEFIFKFYYLYFYKHQL